MYKKTYTCMFVILVSVTLSIAVIVYTEFHYTIESIPFPHYITTAIHDDPSLIETVLFSHIPKSLAESCAGVSSSEHLQPSQERYKN